MKRILILCEGQSEETFVKRVLNPHLRQFDKVATPVILQTAREESGYKHKGGFAACEQIRCDVKRLPGDTNAICITTMLDYHGLPKGFPGKNTLQGATPYRRVAYLEQAFWADIGEPRFLPYLMLHEFEAFLFGDLNAVFEKVGSRITPREFGDLSRFSSPEEINDGEQTHPAARLQQHLPNFRKLSDGLTVVERIGLLRIRQKCPHFDEWLKKLESL